MKTAFITNYEQKLALVDVETKQNIAIATSVQRLCKRARQESYTIVEKSSPEEQELLIKNTNLSVLAKMIRLSDETWNSAMRRAGMLKRAVKA